MANEVRILVNADDKASRVFQGVQKGGNSLSKTLRSALMPAVAGVGVAFGVLGGVLATSVKEAMESQKVTKQLEAVLKSTGGAAGLTKQQLLDMASAFQRTTTYRDEAVT